MPVVVVLLVTWEGALPTVLIIEADATLAVHLARLVTHAGCQALIAADPLATTALLRYQPDLVICDLPLPLLDAPLTQSLALPPTMPLLLLSASGYATARIGDRIHPVLTKPVDVAAFLGQLDALLPLHH